MNSRIKNTLYGALFTVLLAPFAIKLLLTSMAEKMEITQAILVGVSFAIALPIFVIAFLYFEYGDYKKRKVLLEELKNK